MKSDPLEVLKKFEDPSKQGVLSFLRANVSPVFHTHSLYVPQANKLWPQYIFGSQVLEEVLGLFSKFKEPEELLVGYNSIGAGSTINHLHFQIYHLNHIR